MATRDERSVAFVSMSGRDSAMWFSFTGLYHALQDAEVASEFYFPSTQPDAEKDYNKQCFFYRLKKPVKTFLSVWRLARTLNANHSKVVVFSQGIFSALLVFLLKRHVEVVAWAHEIDNYVARSGLLRGLNYLISDRYMGLRTSTVLVGSDQLFAKAQKQYPRKRVVNSCLPLSGDFYTALKTSTPSEPVAQVADAASPVRILFFGGITAYKGLHHLDEAIRRLPEGTLDIKIIGRGDLKTLAPELYARAQGKKDVVWVNRFASAEEVIEELNKTDMMFAMYDSVTATSLIDIANSTGVPVLASELAFFKTKIVDGVNGFIVNRDSLYSFLNEYKQISCPTRNQVMEHFVTSGVNNQCVDALLNNGVVRR
ncbi:MULTISPECIES: glycosyltransferase [unclassified Enterobacter]|uniref:glycosyltransferase n=1 Tax=unclassified Enterobacter TaxID=2608935 RepID=UPI0011CD987B|nr:MULTISPECIES: glycosyltransferase [unclassified Enterobacter]